MMFCGIDGASKKARRGKEKNGRKKRGKEEEERKERQMEKMVILNIHSLQNSTFFQFCLQKRWLMANRWIVKEEKVENAPLFV